MSNKPTKLKYFGYVRKSTTGDDLQALSIETQIEKIRQHFPDLDIEFIEEKHSAFKPYVRPEFNRMIERIKRGEVAGVIAWHPDRLSRNEVDAATITYMIRLGEIKDLKFVSYQFQNEPSGIWMLQMALSQSQYDSAKKGVDVKRGMEKKISMGWKTGVANTGYLNTPHLEKGSRIIVKDPERFDLVRKMWDLMLTGTYNPPQIMKIANDEWGFKTIQRKKQGGKPLCRSGIYAIFNNRFYSGWLESSQKSGQWTKGSHEPMVTDDEFDRVQILLGKKGKPAPRTREFAFTGLMRCGDCGCGITAEEKNQMICSVCKHKFAYENKEKCSECNTQIHLMVAPTILKYTFYHCTKKKGPCSQGSITLEVLERQINEYIQDIQINQKYLDWAIKHLRKMHVIESKSRNKLYESQEKTYHDVVQQLDRLLDMRMAKELDEVEYATKKAKLNEQKAKMESLLKDTSRRQDRWLELSEKTFNFVHYARFWFAEGDLKKKREILAELGSNVIVKDRNVRIEAPENLLIIKKGLNEVPEARGGLEPEFKPMDNNKTDHFVAVSPAWLRGLGSNQDTQLQRLLSYH